MSHKFFLSLLHTFFWKQQDPKENNGFILRLTAVLVDTPPSPASGKHLFF